MQKTERINIAEVDDGYQVQRIIQIKIPLTNAIPRGAAHAHQAIEQRSLVEFAQRDMAVVMTGEEWFALVAKAAGNELSSKGRRLAIDAAKKLTEQLTAEAKRKADQ